VPAAHAAVTVMTSMLTAELPAFLSVNCSSGLVTPAGSVTTTGPTYDHAAAGNEVDVATVTPPSVQMSDAPATGT